MSKNNGEGPPKPEPELVAVQRVILCAPLQQPVEFRVEPDAEEFPDALIMATYIGKKLIARKATPRPPKQVEEQMRLKGKSVIPDIRPMIYTGLEEEPGGDLKAILQLPANPLRYEDLPSNGIDPKTIGPLLTLGMQIRVKETRTHPKELYAECCAHLDEILDGTEAPVVEESRIIVPNPRRPVGPLMCPHNVPWRDCRICRS